MNSRSDRPISTALAATLKTQREFLGVTQAHVALNAGCAEATLRYIEAGHHSPSVELLERIANVLDMDLSDLIEEAEITRDAG